MARSAIQFGLLFFVLFCFSFERENVWCMDRCTTGGRPEEDVLRPALSLSLPYSFETGSLAGPGAQLAASNPVSDLLALPQEHQGYRQVQPHLA